MRYLALAAALLAALLMATGEAFARGGGRHHHHHARPHFRSHVFIAAPLLAAPAFYYPRHYYVPAPVYAPPVYIEQAPAAPESYWYYCAPSGAYYPYVTDCPGGWQRVVPQNPTTSPAG